MPMTVAEPCNRPGSATLIADTGSERVQGPVVKGPPPVLQNDRFSTLKAEHGFEGPLPSSLTTTRRAPKCNQNRSNVRRGRLVKAGG